MCRSNHISLVGSVLISLCCGDTHGGVRLHRSRLQLKCDGTRAETRFRLSPKRKSPFKSAEASVQSTTGSRGVRISGSNAGYTMFRGSVKSTGYPLHSTVSPSLPRPCVTVCHHISTGLYIHTTAHSWFLLQFRWSQQPPAPRDHFRVKVKVKFTLE